MADEDREQDPEQRSDAEWRELLPADVYAVTRQGATEPPGSGCFYLTDQPGSYRCACCRSLLFDAGSKYHSGSGWPSFHSAAAAGNIRELEDSSLGMVRTEVRCAACDAHLGHLFPDGPPPSGLRYCINSLALTFEPQEE